MFFGRGKKGWRASGVERVRGMGIQSHAEPLGAVSETELVKAKAGGAEGVVDAAWWCLME